MNNSGTGLKIKMRQSNGFREFDTMPNELIPHLMIMIKIVEANGERFVNN